MKNKPAEVKKTEAKSPEKEVKTKVKPWAARHRAEIKK